MFSFVLVVPFVAIVPKTVSRISRGAACHVDGFSTRNKERTRAATKESTEPEWSYGVFSSCSLCLSVTAFAA